MAKLPKNNVMVGPDGRVVIPAELRKQLGIKPGDVLAFLVEDSHLALMTPRQVEESIWAYFKDKPDDVSLTDRLIERRGEDSRLEEKEARERIRGRSPRPHQIPNIPQYWMPLPLSLTPPRSPAGKMFDPFWGFPSSTPLVGRR